MSAPTKQDLGLTFVIDNTFAGVMGVQVYPPKKIEETSNNLGAFCTAETLRKLQQTETILENKKNYKKGYVTLGDIFNIALELPNVKAAIIPNHIYSWELQGKVYNPCKHTDYINPLGEYPSEILKSSASFFKDNGDLQEHHELQSYLHEPTATRGKLIIAENQYDKSNGFNIKNTIRTTRMNEGGTGVHHVIEALKKEKRLKGNQGEKEIVDLIKNTETGTPVCILSNDENAFIKDSQNEGLAITKFKTKDGHSVAFSTNLNFFSELTASDKVCEYINQRLHEDKKLPQNVNLTAQDIRTSIYNHDKDCLHRHELIADEKGKVTEVKIIRESFAAGIQLQPALKAVGAALPTQGTNMKRPNYHHGFSGGMGV